MVVTAAPQVLAVTAAMGQMARWPTRTAPRVVRVAPVVTAARVAPAVSVAARQRRALMAPPVMAVPVVRVVWVAMALTPAV